MSNCDSIPFGRQLLALTYISLCGTIIGLFIKISIMKIIGIILIAAGIVMLVMKGFSFTQEKKIVDIGPLEINANEK